MTTAPETTSAVPTITQAADVGALLTELRQVVDQREAHERKSAQLWQRKLEIEEQLIAFHRSTGTTTLGNDSIGVTIDPHAMRVKIDGEKWDDLIKNLITDGKGYLIQRRITESKVMELVDNGVPLPDGINVEGYVRVSFRRK